MDYFTVSTLAAVTPLLAIATAFVTPLIYSFRRSRLAVFTLSEVVFLINAFITSYVLYYVLSSGSIIYYFFAGFPPPLGIAYHIDATSAFVGALVGMVFPVVNAFAYRYLERDKGVEWYLTLYLGLQGGLLGMAYTGDVFNLFVMLEVTSVATYALTAFRRELGYPLDAAVKYALVGSVASTIYFIAVVVAYRGLGTLSMADMASAFMGLQNAFGVTSGSATNLTQLGTLVLGLAVWAFLIESALFPHHFWLPDAYSAAPATVSATLAAVAEGVATYVVLRYIYTVVGINYALWLKVILLLMGSVAVIFGGFLLTMQTELKRLVAYSTVMDVGFVFIGVGLGSRSALQATLYYVLSHAVVKTLLFLTSGAVEYLYGTTNLEKLRGRLRSAPVLALGLVVGGLAVAGIPPTNLFMAKLQLIISSLEEGAYPLIFVIVFGSALALVGFLRVFYATYFQIEEVPKKLTSTRIFTALILALSLATLALGISYGYVNQTLVEPVVNSLIEESSRLEYVEVAENSLKLVLGG